MIDKETYSFLSRQMKIDYNKRISREIEEIHTGDQPVSPEDELRIEGLIRQMIEVDRPLSLRTVPDPSEAQEMAVNSLIGGMKL